MRHELTYRCRFDYSEPAAESHNELRVVPLTDDDQVVQHARVETQPGARVLTTTDYWGTRVDAFGVRAPHEELVVEVHATVDCTPPPVVDVLVPLDALGDVDFRDDHRELLDDSPMAAPDDSVRALADEVAEEAAAADVVALAAACCRAVAARVRRVGGVTDVGARPGDVLELGQGACQDRAHLLVALARSLDVPARYVSGYVTDSGTCEYSSTHAWVEVAVPGEGWHTLDPCLEGPVTDERIVIGRARDYGDVAPMRGTYVGGPAPEPEVHVEVEPVVPFA